MALQAESFIFRGVQYIAQWNKCGKSNCTRCPHGPYWYAIISVGQGKPIKRYIGKHLKGAVAKHYVDHYGGNTEP